MPAPKTIFYQLPARLLEAGMSTDDGQDVLKVTEHGGDVLYHVYTPRPDDPEQDEYNQCCAEGRMRKRDDRVDLAVFEDTQTDGSGLPEAIITEVLPDADTKATA